MHRIAAVVAAMVVVAVGLAGCGGTDWNTAKNAAVKSARTAKSAKTPSGIAAEAKAERPLIAALVASSKSTNPRETAAQTVEDRCVATAIVHGYGTTAFHANGITANGLRGPRNSLDALPDPSEAQVAAIGAALQRCHIVEVAPGIAKAFGVTDGAEIACLAGHFGTGADAHRFLVLTALNRHVSLAAAHDTVGILASCVDLPTLILRLGNVQVDSATRTCIIDEMNGAGAQLKDYFALKLAGADPDIAQQSIEAVGVAINHCRPGAHTGFTVPSG
jgi:hypothetical protein